ncbi:MAG: GDYXXLXY domain-containing protein [Synergistaceae bacterium]|jgi:uncharacterized membrane-anchored protein|nr:GDYXXLXY domain-containing protein [Synergistaceae bacterium]
MKRAAKYLLAALLPLTVLLIRPLTPLAVLMFGQEIRLSTEPVDPRDLFRGDYVTLRFSIERLDESLVKDGSQNAISANRYTNEYIPYIYVTLSPGNDGIWRAVEISAELPELPKEGLYLRARVRNNTLDYGDYLKRYYVQENTGRELELAAQRGEIVAVAKAWMGRVVLTSLQGAKPLDP